MNCPRCGTPVPPGGAFCSRCGLPVAQMTGQPGYAPPKQKSTVAIVLIILAVVFGGGIFVIAILAAILFPVFAKVRGNARLAACEANVKQIDLGILEYTQDYNKYPPSAANYKSVVFPYIKSEQVFHCPADSAGGESYSFNTNLQGVSIAHLNAPSQTVVLYEGRGQTLDFRHDGKAVVGFADGSVRAIPQEQAGTLRWKP